MLYAEIFVVYPFARVAEKWMLIWQFYILRKLPTILYFAVGKEIIKFFLNQKPNWQ